MRRGARRTFTRYRQRNLPQIYADRRRSTSEYSGIRNINSSTLHSGIIRPPVGDGLLNVRAAEFFIDRALEKSGKCRVRGEAESNGLRIREFADTQAQRFRQDSGEANALFCTNNTVLKVSGPTAEPTGEHEQGHGYQQEPCSADSRMTKQEITDDENIDQQDGQNKKVKRRVELGMVCDDCGLLDMVLLWHNKCTGVDDARGTAMQKRSSDEQAYSRQPLEVLFLCGQKK